MTQDKIFDVIIVGGSYAGLSAALALGRALRTVLIIDNGNPCNAQTPYSYNFLTQDGKKPAEINSISKEQVLNYPTVNFFNGLAKDGRIDHDLFVIEAENAEIFKAKKLLFATGVLDIMPAIPGFSECWGISVLHCPYCHGYEIKNENTGILANGTIAYEIAKTINQWTSSLTIFTDGKAIFSTEELKKLASRKIQINEKLIEKFENKDGYIENIKFKDESKHNLKAIYVTPHSEQKCTIPQRFKCKINEHGCIETDIFQQTTVAGIYAAGDCTSVGRSIAVAVAAGSVAGTFISKELTEENF